METLTLIIIIKKRMLLNINLKKNRKFCQHFFTIHLKKKKKKKKKKKDK